MAKKITKKDFIDALKEMSLVEINELVEGLKEEFGIDPSAVAVAGPAAGAGPAAEEKSSFNVILQNFGANKIAVIKAVRTITNVGLADAKNLVETPNAVIKENVNKDEAEKIKKTLEEAGAAVELK